MKLDGHIADMANLKLTDKIISSLPCPATGQKRYYDSEVSGFGCRVTAAGSKSFILNYRTRGGIERRFTIGSCDDWSVKAAREEAQKLKRDIDQGGDPVAALTALREAPTVSDLCKRYIVEHLPKKRVSSQGDDVSMIANDILPKLKSRKVADVTFSDIDALHRQIAKRASYRANRVVALLSKMFALAIKWDWRPDNPAKGIERTPEVKRHRYLSGTELASLTTTLAAFQDQQAADIIRLLLLTGARRGEVQSMRWTDLNLDQGVWVKPGATTKQKTMHRVPLSVAARQLLAELFVEAQTTAKAKKRELSEFVFPSHGSHRVEIKHEWADICKAAGIKDARIHDLRHTYASVLASQGLSLPVIGALLGHTQMQTTLRYSHLFDDPLRQATERAATVITGKPKAEVLQLKERA
jgi:integrase